ncbi:unnamed protein product [Dibothriocephalus latus]|uniref:BEACH-type PH domain-containing protein n=1 Tax=Dibothriocephalus latus TaxID=60516 RepID=A0A3P7PHG8_DIBLA|nr:unnamed protein product [Dibothriocephalus latus]
MGSILGKQRWYFRLPYDKIREVHRRRYLLQQTALEVFNCDGCNFLLVFAKDLRNKVFDSSVTKLHEYKVVYVKHRLALIFSYSAAIHWSWNCVQEQSSALDALFEFDESR